MSTVSKITVGTTEFGYDSVFVEGDFPTYSMMWFGVDTDESVVEEVLEPQNHNEYLTTGREAQRLAALTNPRVIYQA